MSSKLLHKDTHVEQMPWRHTAGGGLVAQHTSDSQQPSDWEAGGTAAGQPEEAHSHDSAMRELEGKVLLLERKVDEERKKAHSQGHQEGLAAGRQQEAAKWVDPLARLARTIDEVSKTKTRFHSESEEDAVKLALAIARKILNRELSVDPEALAGLVNVAMSKLNQRELHRVRVHPADSQAIQQLLGKNAGPIRIEVQADSSLERGAAIFETERGTLDASVNTQLREIERGLADMLNQQS